MWISKKKYENLYRTIDNLRSSQIDCMKRWEITSNRTNSILEELRKDINLNILMMTNKDD